ncbi:MAG: hypothetical protein RLZZ177_53 [Pseudomonadota bacterium]|jgi:hypothetical protein
MRFFLVLLMLTLLPLQFSAATASVCCGHIAVAQEPESQQHKPIHQSLVPDAADLAFDVFAFDLDCGSCHANCAAAVMASTETNLDPAGIERREYLAELILPPWHEQPYRPKWSTSAGSGWNAVA